MFHLFVYVVFREIAVSLWLFLLLLLFWCTFFFSGANAVGVGVVSYRDDHFFFCANAAFVVAVVLAVAVNRSARRPTAGIPCQRCLCSPLTWRRASTSTKT